MAKAGVTLCAQENLLPPEGKDRNVHAHRAWEGKQNGRRITSHWGTFALGAITWPFKIQHRVIGQSAATTLPQSRVP